MAKVKPGLGHNGAPLTDDERADLIAYYGDKIRREQRKADIAKAAYDAERQEVNASFALVKGDLHISRQDFQAVLAAQDMTEVEFRRAENKRTDLYALAGLPVGAQMDLFGADTSGDQAAAYADGHRAGGRGADPSPPSHVSSILIPEWARGWSDGQTQLQERLLRAKALIDTKGQPSAEDPVDLNEPDPVDPAEIDRAARRLKKSGFTVVGAA